MRIFRDLIAGLFLLAISTTARSSHIMGGDVSFKQLSRDSIQVVLTLYRDCNGVNIQQPLKAAITSKCGSKELALTARLPEDITPVCSLVDSRCQRSSAAFKYGIQRQKFYGLLVLDNTFRNCCEIELHWKDCCRNSDITTGARDEKYYINAIFNRCTAKGNNSPLFHQDPVMILCLGRDVQYSQGAYDQDRDSLGRNLDSLVYSFTDPLQASTSSVTWNSPYSSDKPLYFYGFPTASASWPKGFHLDTATGDLAFRPERVQQTVMALKVEEFRNGQKIGELRRDLQIVVIICPSNNPPAVSGLDCQPASLDSYFINVCVNSDNSRQICTADKDKDDSISLSWDGQIEGATFKVSNSRHPTGVFDWNPDSTYVDERPYQFVLAASDMSCPIPNVFVKTFKVYVKGSSWNYALKYKKIDECGRVKAWIEDYDSVAGIKSFAWYNDQDSLLGKDSFIDLEVDTLPYMLPLRVKLIDAEGCRTNLRDTVRIDSLKGVKALAIPDQFACWAYKLPLQAKTRGGFGWLRYRWDVHFDNGGFQKYLGDSIELRAEADATITLKVSDSSGCEDEQRFRLIASTELEPESPISDESFCAQEYQIDLLQDSRGFKDGWEGPLVNKQKRQFQASEEDTGRFVLSYTMFDTAYAQCSAVFNKTIWAQQVGQLAMGRDTAICIGSANPLFYFSQYPGHTTLSGTALSYDPARKQYFIKTRSIVPGRAFSYVLSSRSKARCYVNDTMQVKTYEFYEPAFSAQNTTGNPPLTVSFLNETKKSQREQLTWFFGDGGVLKDDDSPTHSYSKGIFDVSLAVLDTLTGCSDTAHEAGLVQAIEPVIIQDLYPSSDTVRLGDSVSISAKVLSSAKDVVYYWYTNGLGPKASPVSLQSKPFQKGWHAVSLHVRDTISRTEDSMSKDSLFLVYTPVTADFSASPLQGTEPLQVSFSNLSQVDSQDIVWQWKSNNTDFSTLKEPTLGLNAGRYSITLQATDTVTGISDSKLRTDYIVVSKVTSGVALAEELGLKVYPNPANQVFFIALKQLDAPVQLSLYSSDGRLVKSQLLSGSKTQVEAKGLETGVYSYRLLWPDGRLVQGRLLLE